MVKVNIYIDNSNVFGSICDVIKASGDVSWTKMYDPVKLAKALVGGRKLNKIYFYCVPPPPWLLDEGEGGVKKHRLASRYYSTIEKLPDTEIRWGYLQGNKDNPLEKNVDTQICSDMVAHAALSEYDVAILASNDGDFTSAIESVRRLGKRVEVLYFKTYFSNSLKRTADLVRKARRSYFKPIDWGE